MNKFIKDFKADLENLKQTNKDELYQVAAFSATEALLILTVTFILIAHMSITLLLFWTLIMLISFYTGYLYFGARYNYINTDKYSEKIYKIIPKGILNWI